MKNWFRAVLELQKPKLHGKQLIMYSFILCWSKTGLLVNCLLLSQEPQALFYFLLFWSLEVFKYSGCVHIYSTLSLKNNQSVGKINPKNTPPIWKRTTLKTWNLSYNANKLSQCSMDASRNIHRAVVARAKTNTMLIQIEKGRSGDLDQAPWIPQHEPFALPARSHGALTHSATDPPR